MNFLYSRDRSPKSTTCSHRPGGFTLIELLVVIAIISLLVSILLPSLKRAKDLAMAAVCMSNLRNVGLTQTLFAEEHDGWTPELYDITNVRWHERLWLSGFIDENTQGPSIFLCPSHPPDGKNYDFTATGFAGEGAGYGFRMSRAVVNANAGNGSSTRYQLLGATITDTTGTTEFTPSNFVYVMDSRHNYWNYAREQWYYFRIWGKGGEHIHMRHSETAGFLFADAHVEMLGYDDVVDNFDADNKNPGDSDSEAVAFNNPIVSPGGDTAFYPKLPLDN